MKLWLRRNHWEVEKAPLVVNVYRKKMEARKMKKMKKRCCELVYLFLLRVKWKFHHPYEGVGRNHGDA